MTRTHTFACLCVYRVLLSRSFPQPPAFSILLPVSYKAPFLLPFFFPEPLQKEVQSMAFLEVVSKLRSHENKTVAQQASLTEQRLAVESWGRSCFQCIPSQVSTLSFVLLPLPLCFPLYHSCMRVMFPHKLMNCCRYPSKKGFYKFIGGVNMNLSPPVTVLLVFLLLGPHSRMCML